MNANVAISTPFRPLDEVESELLETWNLPTQVTHRFLVLLREFDLRQGWAQWGSADCADWLNSKCGISRNTAQEKLRTAKASYELPQIEAAFAAGTLSYSKVRTLSRVANSGNECDGDGPPVEVSVCEYNGSFHSSRRARTQGPSQALAGQVQAIDRHYSDVARWARLLA